MKKIVSIFLFSFLILQQGIFSQSVWDGTATAWTSGSGTSTSPYLIESAQQLSYLAEQVNLGNLYTSKYFRLDTDIDLNNINWIPIGKNNTVNFAGYFNGNNHKIYNLYIDNDSTGNYQGLFGYTGQYCSLSNIKIESGSITALSNVGAVVGYLSPGSTITNCTNRADIRGTTYVGGIMGATGYDIGNMGSIIKKTTISQCINYGDINGVSQVGGVTGNACNVSECYNKGAVNGTSTVGGIVGSMLNSSISKSENTATVIGTTNVGGIVGSSSSIVASILFNSGMVQGNNRVGGLFGSNETDRATSTFTSCLNVGRVLGTMNTGGFYGITAGGETFTNCFYDKQMADKSLHSTDNAYGKLTTQLLGDSLKEALGESLWKYNSNLYPRFIDGNEDTDEVLLAATPVIFAATDDSYNNKANTVIDDFSVITDNGVTWSSVNGKVSINGSSVTLSYFGYDTLVATYNGLEKHIPITMISTLSNPLTIDNAADMAAFRDAVVGNASYKGVEGNGGFHDMYILLTTDINLSSVCGENILGKDSSWVPIGNNTKRFKGYFNGDGHSIYNLYINNSSSYSGLFGYIEEATLENIHVVSGSVSSSGCVGGIVGSVYGKSVVKYCTNNAFIKGISNVGGIIGISNYNSDYEEQPTVSNCVNSGWVEGTSYPVGGIAGRLSNTQLSYCLNAGLVRGQMETGGIIGTGQTSSVKYCINTGEVRETENRRENMGAIAGRNYSGLSISQCYYDKQLSAIKGGLAYTDISGTVSKKTSEMLGTLLQSKLGTTNWVFTEGLYPRVKTGVETQEIGILPVAPIYLNYTDDDDYETLYTVGKNLTVSLYDGISWKSTTGKVYVYEDSISYQDIGLDTLVASLNGIERSVRIRVVSSSEHPITIDSLSDLLDFREAVNNNSTYKTVASDGGFDGMYFLLTKDIDLSSVCGESVEGAEVSWTPISNKTNTFSGYFDGNNNKITNLYINSTDGSGNIGLFSYVIDAKIANLILEDGEVNTNSSSSSVGGILGSANYDTYVINCTNKINVNGGNYVGGVVGYEYMNPVVKDCKNYGPVTGRFSAGIVGGIMNAKISGCVNYGKIGPDDMSKSQVGGIVGSAMHNRNYTQYPETYIDNCSNKGEIIGYNNIGGIASYISEDVHISGCTNTGKVSGNDYIGGIVGYNYVYYYSNPNISISECSNTGYISGNDYIGGIVSAFSGSIFTNCFNSGIIQGSNYVGGLAGYSILLTNSVNVGFISASEEDAYIGGIVGKGQTVTACYYDKQICPVDTAVGYTVGNYITLTQGKLTSEMTGTQLGLGTTWEYATDLYPRIKAAKDSIASIVAATPTFLQNSETVDSVATYFFLGTDNGVNWSNENPLVASISGTNVSLLTSGTDSLYASYNGTIYKTIPYIANPVITGYSNTVSDKNTIVYSVEKTIFIKGKKGEKIDIYNSMGKKFISGIASDAEERFFIPSSGIYIVVVGETKHKVLIK